MTTTDADHAEKKRRIKAAKDKLYAGSLMETPARSHLYCHLANIYTEVNNMSINHN